MQGKKSVRGAICPSVIEFCRALSAERIHRPVLTSTVSGRCWPLEPLMMTFACSCRPNLFRTNQSRRDTLKESTFIAKLNYNSLLKERFRNLQQPCQTTLASRLREEVAPPATSSEILPKSGRATTARRTQKTGTCDTSRDSPTKEFSNMIGREKLKSKYST